MTQCSDISGWLEIVRAKLHPTITNSSSDWWRLYFYEVKDSFVSKISLRNSFRPLLEVVVLIKLETKHSLDKADVRQKVKEITAYPRCVWILQMSFSNQIFAVPGRHRYDPTVSKVRIYFLLSENDYDDCRELTILTLSDEMA